MGGASDGLVVVLGLYRVCLIFLNLECVESFRRCGESGGLHVGELVGENCSDYGLVVCVVGEVHEDGIGVDVGVFGRVNPCEVLVLDEDWAMRR